MTPLDDDAIPYTIVSGRLPGGSDDAAGAQDLGYYLVAIAGEEPGRVIELGADPVTIGRDGSQTVAFPGDGEMSRRHARVTLQDGQVVAEDLGSTNGTFVDGTRLTAPATLKEGGVLRVGRQSLKYERRSRRDVQRAKALDKDLAKARHYVNALLPAPIDDGLVRAHWTFVPSTQLGGDAFGYDWVDPQTFVFYLIDVAGHGAGSAMHSVAVMNVLKQRALPDVDFTDPAAVLGSLNERFQMETHNGLYFTLWYGVYRTTDRSLAYGTAGHHAAYLMTGDGAPAQALGQSALMIGALPIAQYSTERTTVPPGSRLYVFSDGVFEIVEGGGRQWSLADFVALVQQAPQPGAAEPGRIYAAVRAAARPGPLDDDFTLLVIGFE